MSEYKNVICFECKHFSPFVMGCEAFDELPDEIMSGKNKHEKPLPNQKNNIVFERRNADEQIQFPPKNS